MLPGCAHPGCLHDDPHKVEDVNIADKHTHHTNTKETWPSSPQSVILIFSKLCWMCYLCFVRQPLLFIHKQNWLFFTIYRSVQIKALCRPVCNIHFGFLAGGVLDDKAKNQTQFCFLEGFFQNLHKSVVLHDSFHIDEILSSRCTEAFSQHNTPTTVWPLGCTPLPAFSKHKQRLCPRALVLSHLTKGRSSSVNDCVTTSPGRL